MPQPKDTQELIYESGEIEQIGSTVRLTLHCGNDFRANAAFLNLSKLLQESRLYIGPVIEK